MFVSSFLCETQENVADKLKKAAERGVVTPQSCGSMMICIRRNSLSANNDNPCLVSAFQLTSGYVSSVLNTCICSSHSKQEVDTFQCRKEF